MLPVKNDALREVAGAPPRCWLLPRQQGVAERTVKTAGLLKMMNDTPEPTLRDVMDHLIGIDRRLVENNEQVRNLGDRLDRIEGRLDEHGERVRNLSDRLDRIEGRLDEHGEQIRNLGDRLDRIEGRLDGVDGQLRALRVRMDKLEQAAADVLKDGLTRVEAAVRGLSETKADRSEVAELRADVDTLKEAAG